MMQKIFWIIKKNKNIEYLLFKEINFSYSTKHLITKKYILDLFSSKIESIKFHWIIALQFVKFLFHYIYALHISKRQRTHEWKHPGMNWKSLPVFRSRQHLRPKRRPIQERNWSSQLKFFCARAHPHRVRRWEI